MRATPSAVVKAPPMAIFYAMRGKNRLYIPAVASSGKGSSEDPGALTDPRGHRQTAVPFAVSGSVNGLEELMGTGLYSYLQKACRYTVLKLL